MKPLTVWLLFLFTTHLGQCFDELLFKTLKEDQSNYLDAPKNWFLYIKALVQHLMVKPNNLVLQMPSYKQLADRIKIKIHWLQRLLNMMDSTCHVEKHIVCSDSHMVLQFIGHILHSSAKTTLHINNSSSSSLDLHATALGPFAHFLATKVSYLSLRKWLQFSLSSALSMNISFQHIDFLFKSKYCQDDNLSIFTFVSKNKFTVCTRQSAFNLYPPGNRLSVVHTLFLYIHTHFSVYFLFAVVDSKQIMTNFPTTKDHIQNKGIFPSYVLNSKTGSFQLLTLLLQVSPKHTLVLNKGIYQVGHHFVFDGPGVLSPLLSERKHSLSSFQCVYQHILIYSNQTECNISFSSKQIHAQSEIGLKSSDNFTHFAFSTVCKTSPCLVIVNVSEGIFLNLTILELDLISSEILSCRYGALHIEGIDDDHEQDTFCKNHSFKTSPSESIFLNKSQTHLVLYWYTNYTEVEAVLSLSTTDCNVTIFHVCTDGYLSQMVGYISELELNWYFLQQQFLKMLTKDRAEEQSSKIHHQVLFESSCTIWQLRQQAYTKEDGPISCLYMIQTSLYLIADVKIFSKGNLKHNMHFHGENIGVPNQFCFIEDKNLLCKSDFTECDHSLLEDSHLSLKYSGGKVVQGQLLSFLVSLPGKTGQWIDFTTKTQAISSQKQNSSFPSEGLSKHFQKYLHGETLTAVKTQTYSSTLMIYNHVKGTKMMNMPFSLHRVWCFAFAKSTIPVVTVILQLTPWNIAQLVKAHFTFSYLLLHDQNFTLSMFVFSDIDNETLLSVSSCNEHFKVSPKFDFCFSIKLENVQRFPRQIRRIFTLQGNIDSQRLNSGPYSWQEAFIICKDYGGHLPSVFSHSDLADIVNTVEFMFPTTPLEALYIGLLLNREVCLIFPTVSFSDVSCSLCFLIVFLLKYLVN